VTSKAAAERGKACGVANLGSIAMPRDKWEETWPMKANAVGLTLVFHRCQFLVSHESIFIIRLFFFIF